MVVVTAQDTDAPPPLSKGAILFIMLLGVSLLVAAVVAFWKLWYCPGALGRFSAFRCRCVDNAEKKGRRCQCIANAQEVKGQCKVCGEIGQPCCTEEPICSYDPITKDYQCDPETNTCKIQRLPPSIVTKVTLE